MWYIKRTPPWYVDRDVSIRNSLGWNYTIRVRVFVVRTPVSSLSFRVQRTSYIRPGRHAHEPGTSSASCCCNGSVGRIETHVSDTYVEVSVGGQALFLPIRRRLKEKEKSVVYKSTWYDLVRYMQAPNRLGDVGEARWPLSHRWTDTSPTLPDAAYDTRNQGRVVSHS